MSKAWAINEDSGAPLYHAAELRRLFAALMYGGSVHPLGARSGVRPHTLPPVTLAGSTVTVQPHAGIVYPGLSPTDGPYLYELEQDEFTVPPADGTNPRTDIVVARLYDDDMDASGQRKIAAEYIIGTPTAAPAPAPSIPAGAFRLGTVSVPQFGGGDPTLAFDGPFTVAAGGILPVRSASELPADGLFDGLFAWDRDTRQLLVNDGTDWSPPTPLPETIYYTATSTFVKANFPGARAVIVEPLGAGGGGGGAPEPSAGQVAMGGGGGGGGYARKFIDLAALSSTETVTVGAGGAGGIGANNGGAGGTSSFGSHASATGGGGGAGAGASSVRVIRNGGNGGVGSSGDVNVRGDDGDGSALQTGGPYYAGGKGGAAAGPYGGGGGAMLRVPSAGADGRPGGNYGGGGGGAHRRDTGGSHEGGNGANGLVVVTVLY